MGLSGARVERVDSPSLGLLCLTLFDGERKRVLAISTLPGASFIALWDSRPSGAKATPAITLLRRQLKGARLIGRSDDLKTLLSFERGDAAVHLVFESRNGPGRWIALDDDGLVLASNDSGIRAGSSWERPRPQTLPIDEEAWSSPTEDGRTSYTQALVAQHATPLDRSLQARLKKLRRKEQAIRKDLERAQLAPALRRQAELLIANLHAIEPAQAVLIAEDWDRPDQTVRISLDPAQSPAEQAEAMFRRAKRLARGKNIAEERLEAVTGNLGALEALRAQVQAASSLEALQTLANTAKALGVVAPSPSHVRSRTTQSRRLPFRTFISQGSRILVGRGAADNDALTLRHARPHDLWLHARGTTGAHVVVPLGKGKDCGAELLIDAATLAAHFSDMRGEPYVDVIYTPRRYVHKRKGSDVGSVSLNQEKVLALRLEPARVQRLLASEER